MEELLGSEGGSSSEDQFSETELGIEELQLALRAMQFRRFVTMVMNNVLFKAPCKGEPWCLFFKGYYLTKCFFPMQEAHSSGIDVWSPFGWHWLQCQ